MATKTEYKTEYRMVRLQASATPEQIESLLEGLAAKQGWTAVTHVPKGGQSFMLMARAVRT